MCAPVSVHGEAEAEEVSPLWANTVGVFHLVAEGIADALAINAREDGAALAVGGTSGFGRLARLIAEAADVSDLLGYSPGGD